MIIKHACQLLSDWCVLHMLFLRDNIAEAPCLTQEFETLLRFSVAGKSEAVRGLADGMVQPGVASAAQKASDDIRLRYSASSAVTNGLEECMEEAEHEQGTSVSEALEGAVLTILREVGEDPDRQVRTLIPIAVQHGCPVCHGLLSNGSQPKLLKCVLMVCKYQTGNGSNVTQVAPYKEDVTQGLRGSAQRYVKFLLASTAGYKELDQNGSLRAAGPGPQPHAHQAPAAQELHIHFMSHCEHHMLPFHGQVGGVCCPGFCLCCTLGHLLSASTPLITEAELSSARYHTKIGVMSSTLTLLRHYCSPRRRSTLPTCLAAATSQCRLRGYRHW